VGPPVSISVLGVPLLVSLELVEKSLPSGSSVVVMLSTTRVPSPLIGLRWVFSVGNICTVSSKSLSVGPPVSKSVLGVPLLVSLELVEKSLPSGFSVVVMLSSARKPSPLIGLLSIASVGNICPVFSES
jgi:hypothetical protein